MNNFCARLRDEYNRRKSRQLKAGDKIKFLYKDGKEYVGYISNINNMFVFLKNNGLAFLIDDMIDLEIMSGVDFLTAIRSFRKITRKGWKSIVIVIPTDKIYGFLTYETNGKNYLPSVREILATDWIGVQ